MERSRKNTTHNLKKNQSIETDPKIIETMELVKEPLTSYKKFYKYFQSYKGKH